MDTAPDYIQEARERDSEGRPALFTIVAFDSDMNLGRAYNRSMVLLSDDAWACFLDHDAMFTTPFWHEQLLRAIEHNPETGAFTAVTNRVGNVQQTAGFIDPNDHDMMDHRRFGESLFRTYEARCDDITMGEPLSGVLIVISKRAWKRIGGFRDGFLGVDNQMHLDMRRIGLRVMILRGLYVYHWYRGDGCAAHLKHLKPKDKWVPR